MVCVLEEGVLQWVILNSAAGWGRAEARLPETKICCEGFGAEEEAAAGDAEGDEEAASGDAEGGEEAAGGGGSGDSRRGD